VRLSVLHALQTQSVESGYGLIVMRASGKSRRLADFDAARVPAKGGEPS